MICVNCTNIACNKAIIAFFVENILFSAPPQDYFFKAVLWTRVFMEEKSFKITHVSKEAWVEERSCHTQNARCSVSNSLVMDERRLNNVDESLKPVAADPMHKYKYPKTPSKS